MSNSQFTKYETTNDPGDNASKYYGSDDGFKYYSIIYSEDYTSCGFYPSFEKVTDPSTGGTLTIGTGLEINQAVKSRD